MNDADPSAEDRRALLARRLRERSEAAQTRPLSAVQRHLWSLAHRDPDVPLYRHVIARRIQGPLDVGALRRAVDTLVARHATLRTTITTGGGGEPAAMIAPAGPGVLTDVDLSAASGRPDDVAGGFADEQARAVLPLRGALFRAVLGRLAEDDHVLVLVAHELICDAASVPPLLAALSAEYRQVAPSTVDTVASAPSQPAAVEAALAYWSERLAGATTDLNLPADRLAPTIRANHGGEVAVALPPDLVTALRAVVSDRGHDLPALLLAAFAGLLARRSGARDLLIGTPISPTGRAPQAIGAFASTVPLRVTVDGDPAFHDLLAHVHGVLRDAQDHVSVPFERFTERLSTQAATAGAFPMPLPLHLVVHDEPEGLEELPGLRLAPLAASAGAVASELTLTYRPDTAGGARLVWAYRTDRFDEATVERLAGELASLLRSAAIAPAARLSTVDRPGVARAARPDEVSTPAAVTALELLNAGQPGAIAVHAEDGTLTFAHLDAHANRLAHRLRAAGVGASGAEHRTVAVCVEQSAAALVALLAVWKAGGAWLPLHPDWPVERQLATLSRAGADVLVAYSDADDRLRCAENLFLDEIGAELDAAPDTAPAPAPVSGAHRACLLPGVGGELVDVPHRAVVHLLASSTPAMALRDGDVFAAISPPASAGSPLELLAPLVAGARLLIVDASEAASGARLARLLDAQRVTALHAAPATWRALLTAGDLPATLRLRLCGGEPLTRQLADALGAPDAAVWQVYGPLWSVAGRVAAAPAPVVLGRPAGATRCHVLDRSLAPVPDGVVGELYFAGDGLAQGYAGRPGLTAERFRPDPHGPPGRRMYRTGDLARSRYDGTLEYIGPAEPASTAGRQPAHDAIEQVIAGIWCDVLGVEAVGVHDDFFKLGGQSLLVVKVLARIRDLFAVDVSLRAFFDRSTVADLAAIVVDLEDTPGQIARIAERLR